MKHTFWYLVIFIAVIASRLLPHPANFSPIAALLLGLPLLWPKQKYLWIVPLLALVASDFFLGFYSAILYVYGSFGLIALLGKYGKRLANPIVSAFLFYTITNFGVWATTAMYAHTLSGLLQSYWMGIPFLKMTLIGDVFFFAIFYALSSLRRQGSRQKIVHFVFTTLSSSNPVAASGVRKN